LKRSPVANAVREARTAAGLTQVDLANRCGVTRQTIGLIEAGRYNPTVKLALLISRAVGRSIAHLFWLTDEGDRQSPTMTSRGGTPHEPGRNSK